MKTIRKVMAVIYDLRDGYPYYLLLHRVLRWYGWELMKGTIENGENNEETIRREIVEETGLKEFKIIGKLGKKIEWIWGDARVLVEDVFIIRTNMGNPIRIDQRVKEHDAYKWVDKDMALNMLTYENSREALEEVDRKLFK